jgi:hypothetical protein
MHPAHGGVQRHQQRRSRDPRVRWWELLDRVDPQHLARNRVRGGAGPANPDHRSTASPAIGNTSGGATFHDFRLLDPIGDPALSGVGGTFDRVFVEGGFFACELGSGAVMRNTARRCE